MIEFTTTQCRHFAKLSKHVLKYQTVEGLKEDDQFTYERFRIAADIMRYSLSGLTNMEHTFTNGIIDDDMAIVTGLQYRLEEEGFNAKISKENTLLISWDDLE